MNQFFIKYPRIVHEFGSTSLGSTSVGPRFWPRRLRGILRAPEPGINGPALTALVSWTHESAVESLGSAPFEHGFRSIAGIYCGRRGSQFLAGSREAGRIVLVPQPARTLARRARGCTAST